MNELAQDVGVVAKNALRSVSCDFRSNDKPKGKPTAPFYRIFKSPVTVLDFNIHRKRVMLYQTRNGNLTREKKGRKKDRTIYETCEFVLQRLSMCSDAFLFSFSSIVKSYMEYVWPKT